MIDQELYERLAAGYDYDPMYAEIITERDRLREENTRLRELIRKAWKWGENGCYKCPLEEGCTVQCVYDGDCGMGSRNREGYSGTWNRGGRVSVAEELRKHAD